MERQYSWNIRMWLGKQNQAQSAVSGQHEIPKEAILHPAAIVALFQLCYCSYMRARANREPPNPRTDPKIAGTVTIQTRIRTATMVQLSPNALTDSDWAAESNFGCAGLRMLGLKRVHGLGFKFHSPTMKFYIVLMCYIAICSLLPCYFLLINSHSILLTCVTMLTNMRRYHGATEV